MQILMAWMSTCEVQVTDGTTLLSQDTPYLSFFENVHLSLMFWEELGVSRCLSVGLYVNQDSWS